MGQRETANINRMIMIFRKWDLLNLITYIIRSNIILDSIYQHLLYLKQKHIGFSLKWVALKLNLKDLKNKLNNESTKYLKKYNLFILCVDDSQWFIGGKGIKYIESLSTNLMIIQTFKWF